MTIGHTVLKLEITGTVKKIPYEVQMRRIGRETELDRFAASVDWVQECLPEKLQVKGTAFAEIGKLACNTVVLASSSSGLCTSEISADLPNKESMLVAIPSIRRIWSGWWKSPRHRGRTKTLFDALTR